MSRYADTVRDQYGVAIEGATIYVYDQFEQLADLTEDGGGALANPITTDAYGSFHFNAADGLYQLKYIVGGKQVLIQEGVMVGEGPALPDEILAALSIPGRAALIGSNGPSNVQVDLDARPTFAELASSIGSTLIGYLAPGVGAVMRTVYQVIEDLPVNYIHYGGTGDGIAFDKIAFQKAIDANKGKTIVIPHGRTCNAAGILLDGPAYNNTKIRVDGEFLLTPSGGTTTETGGTNFQNAFWGGIIFRDCEGVSIGGPGRINANRANQPRYEYVHAVVYAGVRNSHNDEINLYEMRGDGIYITQADVAASSTNSSKLTFGKITAYNAVENDGRNACSVISCDDLTIGTFQSVNVGGDSIYEGFTSVMPGGLDIEPDHAWQSCKNINVGTLSVKSQAAGGLGIGGRPGTLVTDGVHIGSATVINTSAPNVVDGLGNTTLTNRLVLNILDANNVTIGSFEGRHTGAYGAGIQINASDRVKIKGAVSHVHQGVLVGVTGADSYAGAGVTNSEIDMIVSDWVRYGFFTGEMTNCNIKGLTRVPVTGYYGSLYPVLAGTFSQIDVTYSVSVTYHVNIALSYRNDGASYARTTIRDCQMVGNWTPGTAMYGDIKVRRINVQGITDQAAIPTGGAAIWVAGQEVRNNSGTIGQPRGWTFSTTNVWTPWANL